MDKEKMVEWTNEIKITENKEGKRKKRNKKDKRKKKTC